MISSKDGKFAMFGLFIGVLLFSSSIFSGLLSSNQHMDLPSNVFVVLDIIDYLELDKPADPKNKYLAIIN